METIDEAMKNNKPVALTSKAKVTQGVRIAVPEGHTLTSLVKEGMRQGGATEAIAKTLGMEVRSYRVIRQLLLLHDDDRLTASERQIVGDALKYVDEERRVADAIRTTADVVRRYWRYGTSSGRSVADKREATKRRDKFMHALFMINEACTNNEEITVPALSKEDRIEAIVGIAQSIAALGELLGRLQLPDE